MHLYIHKPHNALIHCNVIGSAYLLIFYPSYGTLCLTRHCLLCRYTGSLTTPPCSQGVSWHVTTSRHGVSLDDIARFTAALHDVDNARPVQDLNDRVLRKLINSAQ